MDGAEVSGLIRARVTQVCSVSADEFEEPVESRFSVRVLPADSETPLPTSTATWRSIRRATIRPTCWRARPSTSPAM
jgi:predicted AAA+ superfamily ATPase